MSEITLQAGHRHAPVTTLADLLALDEAELLAGYMSTQKGDPEPGMNHSRAYHHGWRTRMMDLHEIEIPYEHRVLVRAYCEHMRRTGAVLREEAR